MSPAAKESYKQLFRWQYSELNRPRWCRIWCSPITWNVDSWFARALCLACPLAVFGLVNGLGSFAGWIIFSLAIVLRTGFGTGNTGDTVEKLAQKTFAPLEENEIAENARVRERPWAWLLIIEAAILATILYYKSTSALQWFLIPLYVGSVLVLLWKLATIGQNNPPKDIPWTCRDGEKSRLEKWLGTKWKNIPRLKWFDRLYQASLTTDETKAAKILFRDRFENPSSGILAGWILGLIFCITFALPYFTNGDLTIAIFSASFLLGFPVATVVIVSILCGFNRPLANGTLSYQDGLKAYIKLAIGLWIFGWIPAAGMVLWAVWAIYGESAFTTGAWMAAKVLMAAPGYICIGVLTQLATPVGVPGGTVKMLLYTVLSYGTFFALLLLPFSFLRQINPDGGSTTSELGMVIGGTLYAILLLVLHRQGWKRSWYDV